MRHLQILCGVLAALCISTLEAAEDSDMVGPWLTPIWSARPMHGDTLFFVQADGAPAATSTLLFTPTEPPVLRSADGKVTFEMGKDFTWEPGSREIKRTADSRIPFKTRAQMFPPKGSPQSINESADHKTALFFGEGHLYHDLQVTADYARTEKWDGFTPQSAGENLPRTMKKLAAKEGLKLVVLGDSISEGYNASGFAKVNAAPGQPPYPDLVAAGLQRKFGSKVELKNMAVAGQATGWGIKMAPRVAAEKPDLVIIAFGMNDSGGLAPAGYAANMKKIMAEIRKTAPDAEFILAATMIGNPDWAALKQERFPQYRDELKKLAGPGIAVADVTTLWADLLKRKKFVELTGNGVNHPNDFGHRLYAHVILGLLAEAK